MQVGAVVGEEADEHPHVGEPPTVVLLAPMTELVAASSNLKQNEQATEPNQAVGKFKL